MAETPFAETEVLLMMIQGRPHDEVVAYLEENFTGHELIEFTTSLDDLSILAFDAAGRKAVDDFQKLTGRRPGNR